MSELKNSDSLEDELDAIRLKLYEEMKDMTPAERAAYISAAVAPIGITPISTAQAKTA